MSRAKVTKDRPIPRDERDTLVVGLHQAFLNARRHAMTNALRAIELLENGLGGKPEAVAIADLDEVVKRLNDALGEVYKVSDLLQFIALLRAPTEKPASKKRARGRQ